MNKDCYIAFCQQHQARLPIFVQPWYLDAVCAGGAWDAAVLEAGGEVLAVLPYFLKQKLGFRYVTMPHFTKHMGVFFAEDFPLSRQHQLLEALIAQLPKLHAFHQSFHPDFTNWLPFYWSGFRQTTRYTYRLNVSDLDEVSRNINRNMRRNIKKAQENLTVTTGGTPEAFYAINRLSFERQNLQPPYTFEQFQRHDAALAAHNARQFFFAQDESGRVHAAAYLIWDAQRSYYHLSGDDPDLRDSGAGILLVWEAIRYTNEVLKLQSFDFEGSMIPSVEAIRRQFGAVQVPYFDIQIHHSMLLQFLSILRNKKL